MRWWLLTIGALAVGSPGVALVPVGEAVCPRLKISPPQVVSFREAERRLLCGDPQNTSWNQIPENQVRFHLTAFLQDRGYFFPRFTSTAQGLEVVLGDETRVKQLDVRGAPLQWDAPSFRQVVGQVLTPALLDKTKLRLRHKFQTWGYACPEIDIKAIASTGTIVVEVNPGEKLPILRAEADPIESLSDEVPHRYRAFRLGAHYNPDFLAVTVDRTLEAGLAQSTHFTTTCVSDGVHLGQSFILGPPRRIRIGFGVDTEQILMGRAQWSHNRLGKMGSQLDVSAWASFRSQELSAFSKWYFLPYPSRYFLRPSFHIRRNVEKFYELYEGRLQFAPGMTWDSESVGFEAQGGPALNFTDTVVGLGADSVKFLSFAANAILRSHYFEFYRTRPQEGFEVRAETNLTFRNAFSPVSAQAFRLFFTQHWNIGDLEPAASVISLRGGVETTFTDEDPSQSELLPVGFKTYLGGSSSLRGFGRQELPNKAGALTSLFTGVEIRFLDLLPIGLQPLLFADLGVLGRKTLQLNKPLFWSPGVGLRWASPLGSLRTTLSHGYLLGEERQDSAHQQHWQFYFSFGEEF